MKRLLPLLVLTACAPKPQPVQVWEGSGRVLLRDQAYRLTFTVNDQTHALRGQLENRSNGVKYLVDGTFLPVQGGAEITAKVTAGEGAKLNASILGFGLSNVAVKSDALLTGRVAGHTFNAELTVNGVRYDVQFTRSQ